MAQPCLARTRSWLPLPVPPQKEVGPRVEKAPWVSGRGWRLRGVACRVPHPVLPVWHPLWRGFLKTRVGLGLGTGGREGGRAQPMPLRAPPAPGETLMVAQPLMAPAGRQRASCGSQRLGWKRSAQDMRAQHHHAGCMAQSRSGGQLLHLEHRGLGASWHCSAPVPEARSLPGHHQDPPAPPT